MAKSETTVTVSVKSVINAIAEMAVNDSAVNAIQKSDYGILDRAEKARVRNAFKARFDSAMRDGKFDTAQFNWAIQQAFKNANSGNGKPTVSNSDELRAVIRGMALVMADFVNGVSAPNGIDPVDLSDEFNSSFEFTGEWDGEEPEFTPELLSRFVPKRISRNSPSNDIAALVADAFAEFNSGEFKKVSEIRREMARRNPELGIDSGWDGRINARLFPDSGECTIEGVIPMRENGEPNGRKGAAKA